MNQDPARPTKKRKPASDDEQLPPAGPHANPALTNPDVTPGAGTLPPVGESEDPNPQPTG